MKQLFKAGLLSASLLLALPGGVQAADFPDASQVIRLVVPYTAGGSSDFLARTVAKKLSENIDVDIIVDNKPGASTIIGGDYVAKSKPDGYTIYLIGALTNGSLKALNKELPYDPATAFAGITNLVMSPLVISVRDDFPADDLEEFTSYVKDHPGEVNYGSAGLGNTLHLGGAQFASNFDLDMTHIPYKGASQAVVDLVAGRIDVMFDLPQTQTPHIKNGDVRGLAVTSDERLDILPDVPTTEEAGAPDYKFTTRIGLAAPKGTPDDVLNFLNSELRKVMADDAVVKSLADYAMFPDVNETPQEFSDELRDTVDVVTKLLRDAGVEAE